MNNKFFLAILIKYSYEMFLRLNVLPQQRMKYDCFFSVIEYLIYKMKICKRYDFLRKVITKRVRYALRDHTKVHLIKDILLVVNLLFTH